MILSNQTTLRERVVLFGAGVHSNSAVRMALNPADPDTGIVFHRSGLPGQPGRTIKADWSRVSMTELCTVIGDPSGASVSTVEHLLAAFSGLGLDNVLVEIDGPEVPIMDGSAAEFVAAIDIAGIDVIEVSRRYIKVLKPVRVTNGRAFCELRPNESGLHIDVEIDFACPAIGRQKKALDLSPSTFRRDLSRARTFGFLSDVERLWKAGFALGASLDNTVALREDRVLNPEGLRYTDEFVRHKMLDVVGDLALAGAPLLAAFKSYCGGHAMNVSVLRALFADRSAYAVVEAASRRRGAVRPDLGLTVAPAFAPEVR